MRRKDDNNEPTNTFILTFATPTPPKFVKAAYLRIPVELFVPNPLRCYQCQRFGHGKDSCKRSAVCARCGDSGHEDTNCLENPHCVNCGGNHQSYSKDCPEWVMQREISRVKHERRISFGEGKQIVQQQSGSYSGSTTTYLKTWWCHLCHGSKPTHADCSHPNCSDLATELESAYSIHQFITCHYQ